MKEKTGGKLGVAGWIALAVLFALLAAALWYAAHVWTSLDSLNTDGHAGISLYGWIFLAMGVFFSVLVGGGLMALVFYSSRKDYDR